MTDYPKTETAIRAGVAALPWPCAGPAHELFFGHRDRVKAARVEAFVEELRSQVAGLDREKINVAYLESEDFGDLLESVLERVKRIRVEEQRKRLSRVLCGQMTGPIPIDFAELFLDLVMELNASQVSILQEHESCPNSSAKPSFRTPRHYSLNQGQYRYYVQVLISRGLMLEQHAPKTRVGEKYRPFERLEITELGKEFMKFLRHGEGRTPHM